MKSGEGLMYRVRDPESMLPNPLAIPKRSLATPHFAEIDDELRRKLKRESSRVLWGHDPSQKLIDYETVVRNVRPEMIDRIYLPSGITGDRERARFLNELGKRKGGKLVPADWSDVQRKSSDYDKAMKSWKNYLHESVPIPLSIRKEHLSKQPLYVQKEVRPFLEGNPFETAPAKMA